MHSHHHDSGFGGGLSADFSSMMSSPFGSHHHSIGGFDSNFGSMLSSPFDSSHHPIGGGFGIHHHSGGSDLFGAKVATAGLLGAGLGLAAGSFFQTPSMAYVNPRPSAEELAQQRADQERLEQQKREDRIKREEEDRRAALAQAKINARAMEAERQRKKEDNDVTLQKKSKKLFVAKILMHM
jgi:hypothetical protein